MPSRKQAATPEEKDLWGTQPVEPEAAVEEQIAEVVQQQHQNTRSTEPAQYDLEGLMTDFPTARELERFVFDETGVVLNLTVYFAEAVLFGKHHHAFGEIRWDTLQILPLIWIIISVVAMHRFKVGMLSWIGISAAAGLISWLLA